MRPLPAVIITSIALSSPLLHADTSVKEVTCAEVAAGYDPEISQCFDFEAGMPGWTTTGTAFASQPTVGDNVVAARVLSKTQSPLHPGSGTVLDDINGIGGDYWNTGYPIGNQGHAWLGTAEDHSSDTAPFGRTQGEGPTGSAFSPPFAVDRGLVTFLVGGGCTKAGARIELQVLVPQSYSCLPPPSGFGFRCTIIPAFFTTATGFGGVPLTSTGACSDVMYRDVFFTDAFSGLQGKTVRVAVIDASSTEHINVDHILHTNTMPEDFGGKNQPIWGFADTHAHFGNERMLRSLGTTNQDGHVFHGSVGSLTKPDLQNELASCDSQGHGTVHGARVVLHDLEAASLGEAPAWPFGCKEGEDPANGGCTFFHQKAGFATPVDQQHWGQGMSPYPGGADLVGWPYWYTRAHQQMHLSWVQRAYKGGQRLMVASAGNTEALGAAMRGSHQGDYLSDYGSLRRFSNYMKQLAAENSSWMEIALTPEDARRIIETNKLAIVLATENDDLGDHCAGDLTSTADDDPMDHGRTTTTEGKDPWNQVRDRKNAASCTTAAEWTTRVDNLYKVGYRVIMPVHLSDNDLGGSAVYDDKFNSNTRFMTGSFMSVMSSSDVTYTFPETPVYVAKGFWSAAELGWTNVFGILGGQSVMYSVAEYKGAPIPYPYAPDSRTNMTAPGFINTRRLTSRGLSVIDAAKARGMIIDLSHMDQLGRERILGLAGNEKLSPLNNGCDMNVEFCRLIAYPAVATHAGLRDMEMDREYMGGGGKDEGALRADMITRIRDIGGTVGVGTSPADVNTAEAMATSPSTGIFAQTVANTCGGSSRSFAQNYLYVLRKMNGKGLTLGTDMNGLEARINPRFGTQGCYARGNIPWSLQYASDGSLLVSSTSPFDFNFRPSILLLAGGSAGAQRAAEMSTPGLNYTHYTNHQPPMGGHFLGLANPPGLLQPPLSSGFGTLSLTSMLTVSSQPALTPSVTGNRTFDLNYDGFAQYGMLPDLMQDTRVVGMTTEQMEPIFQGAEWFVETWEKGCSLSDPSVNQPGC